MYIRIRSWWLYKSESTMFLLDVECDEPKKCSVYSAKDFTYTNNGLDVLKVASWSHADLQKVTDSTLVVYFIKFQIWRNVR